MPISPSTMATTAPASPLTVGRGRNQPAESQPAEPQHHGDDGRCSRVAGVTGGAGTTSGAGEGPHADDDAGQPDHGPDEGPESPGAHGEDIGGDRMDHGCLVDLHASEDRPEK